MANIHDFPEIRPEDTGGFMTTEWYRRWAAAWKRTYPNLDKVSRANIAAMVAAAEERERPGVKE